MPLEKLEQLNQGDPGFRWAFVNQTISAGSGDINIKACNISCALFTITVVLNVGYLLWSLFIYVEAVRNDDGAVQFALYQSGEFSLCASVRTLGCQN